jgi:branched-chain amino acid transport system ATP-binding protein
VNHILNSNTIQKEQPLLQIERVNFSYGDVHVLWDVSFAVETRKIISLVGSNGAGKTTMLKTIAGVLNISSGQILFDGRPLRKMSTESIVDSGIVYIPEGRGIFADMSIRENLDMGSYSRHARSLHDGNLRKVFSLFPILEKRASQRAGTLSGGESQMLAIGRGIMQAPRLLMLDEPSAGISPLICDSIFETIQRLRDEDSLTVLLVEQDAGRALKICNSAFVLENGRITLSGSGSELLDNQYVKRAYLGL